MVMRFLLAEVLKDFRIITVVADEQALIQVLNDTDSTAQASFFAACEYAPDTFVQGLRELFG